MPVYSPARRNCEGQINTADVHQLIIVLSEACILLFMGDMPDADRLGWAGETGHEAALRNDGRIQPLGEQVTL